MRLLLCTMALVSVVLLAGCASIALGPVPSWITVDQKGPVAVGPSRRVGSKVGVSEAQGILLFSFGDASISAATRKAGITRIHHVDCEVLNVIGVYARYRTVVYGD